MAPSTSAAPPGKNGARTASRVDERGEPRRGGQTGQAPVRGMEGGPLRGLGLAALAVATLEAVDAAARVHQLLLAGVQGVAVAAQLDPEVGHRRSGS